MKRRVSFSLVGICLLMLTAVGCSSISNQMRAEMEGLPSWVYEPQVSPSQVAFIGKATASTSENARLYACTDILNQLSDYIGGEVPDSYYRELTMSSAISSLRLKITHTTSKSTGGNITVYLLAVANKEILESERTQSYNAMLDRQKRISTILAQADEAYRNNRDMETIVGYAQAALIATEGFVEEPEYQFDVLMKRVESYVGALRISIAKLKPEVPSCTVTVKRKSRLLSPKVLGAQVVASFESRDGVGAVYVDNISFKTSAETGTFGFTPVNPGIVGTGEINFTIDITTELEQLERAAGSAAVANLKNLLRQSTVTVAYSRKSTIAPAGVLVDVMEFTLQGALRNSTVATDAIVSEFAIDGTTLQPIQISELDEEDFYATINLKYPQATYLIAGKAGVSDVVPVGGGMMVLANGSVILQDLRNGQVLKNSEEIRVVMWGEDLQQAMDAAFRQFGLTASTLLDRSLY